MVWRVYNPRDIYVVIGLAGLFQETDSVFDLGGAADLPRPAVRSIDRPTALKISSSLYPIAETGQDNSSRHFQF